MNTARRRGEDVVLGRRAVGTEPSLCVSRFFPLNSLTISSSYPITEAKKASTRTKDIAIGLLGLGVALPSLYSPLGRDQGVFLYVGREWLEGRLPYKETFDMKPPAIHAIYALSLALFGDAAWGIRVLDMVAVLIVAMSAVFLSTASPRPGAAGIVIFSTSLFYYGFFDFWNTAQCEIWCAAFSLASLCAAWRMRSTGPACITAGALLAVGGLFKPTTLFVLPLLVAFVGFRLPRASTRERMIRCALTLGSAAVTFGVVAAYFGAHGALVPMVRELSNNVYYIRHGSLVESWTDLGEKLWHACRVFGVFIFPFVAVGMMGAIDACRGRAWRLAAKRFVPATLFLIAFIGVAIQQRFYWYHWGVLAGPVALSISRCIEDIAEVWPRIARKSWLAPTLVGSGCVALFALSGSSAMTKETNLWGTSRGSLLRAIGRISPEQYNARFDFSGGFKYSIPTSSRIADWLRIHSSVNDAIAVRGHEPQIYALAGRHYSGRFFWTSFLALKEWSPDATRAAWLAEDREVFSRSPPRFVVAPSWEKDGPNAERSFTGLGYERRALIDGWAILEYRHVDLLSNVSKDRTTVSLIPMGE